MFKFKYSLNDNDYLEFNRFHLNSSPARRRAYWFSRALFPFMCVMFAFFIHRTMSGAAAWVPIGLLAVIGITWSIGYDRVVFEPLVKRQISRMKKEGKLPYGESETYSFGEDGLRKTTSRGEFSLKYGSFERIEQSVAAIYIYVGAIEAIIIPSRVFENEAAKQEFLEFIDLQLKKTT
jgi:hypothetical protein